MPDDRKTHLRHVLEAALLFAATWAVLALGIAGMELLGGRPPSAGLFLDGAIEAAAILLGLLLALGLIALFVKVFFLRYGLHALNAAVALLGAILAVGALARPQQDPGAHAIFLVNAGFMVLLGVVGEVVFLLRSRRADAGKQARRTRTEAAARSRRD